MASHAAARYNGPETIEALTADRERIWQNFTAATKFGVVFMVVLLVAMAVFLL